MFFCIYKKLNAVLNCIHDPRNPPNTFGPWRHHDSLTAEKVKSDVFIGYKHNVRIETSVRGGRGLHEYHDWLTDLTYWLTDWSTPWSTGSFIGSLQRPLPFLVERLCITDVGIRDLSKPGDSRRGRAAVYVRSECRSCPVASPVERSWRSDSSWTRTIVHRTRRSARPAAPDPEWGSHWSADPDDRCRRSAAGKDSCLRTRLSERRHRPRDRHLVWWTTMMGE